MIKTYNNTAEKLNVNNDFDHPEYYDIKKIKHALCDHHGGDHLNTDIKWW